MDNTQPRPLEWPGLRLPVRQAAATVAARLEAGLAQDGAVHDFMESAFGSSGPRALAAILGQGDTADAFTLRALLLAPGPDLLTGLEPALEAARCTPDEALAVAEHLAGTCRETWVILPDEAQPDTVPPGEARSGSLPPAAVPVAMALEPEDVRAFVRGLRLDRTAPPELGALVDARFPLEEALALKVLLRHCRLAWPPGRLGFLATLLNRLESGEPAGEGRDARAVLAWALRFLDSAGPQAPAGPALARRYRDLRAQLARAEQFERMLARSSYEIMMSQGLRSPLLHAGSLREELALLDRVCRAVLGRPAAFLDALTEADLGVYQDAEALLAALAGLD